MRQIRDIVPAAEWLDSPYYNGASSGKLYPFWRDHFIKFWDGEWQKFIFSGSYSLGKTYAALTFLKRWLYEMSCFVDIPEAFDLDPASKMMYAFVSVSVAKAQSSGISKLLRMVDSTPYFNDHCPRDMNTSSRLDLGFMEVVHASNVGHLIAEDFMGVIFDEANYVQAAKGEEYELAKTLYLESNIRAHTRFSVEGKSYGFFGLLSSTEKDTSFSAQEIKRARAIGDTYVVEAATYDVKPKGYAKERFSVFIGMDEIQPFIVDEVDSVEKENIAKTYGLSFNQFLESHPTLLERVPVDLKQYYRTDITYALKTLSGKTVRGSSKLIKNPGTLDRAYKDNGLQNPLMVEIPTLSLLSDDTISDFIDEQKLLANYEEGCPVFIHLDPSKKGDKTGFGAVYKSETTGKFRQLLSMSIHKKQESDQIDLSKVEDIIYYMRDLGMSIRYVSYDTKYSLYIEQNLIKRFGKDRTGELSVDRDDSAYMIYLFLLKKGLMEQYYYHSLDVNMKNLDHDRASMKVDHPDETEKDDCDGLAGAVFTCFKIMGLTREEMIANLTLSGYEDTDKFYDDLLLEKKEGADNWFADLV